MKIILTCGHPHSNYSVAHEALISAGLSAARPSRRERLSAEQLQADLFKAYDLHGEEWGSFAPLSPGKIWQDLAVDLFLGNLDAGNWGFANWRTARLLDFWMELDPQIRFILVYSAPEHTVGQMLRNQVVTLEGIDRAIASWMAFHAEMLRFYHRHSDRCLLVNTSAVISDPAEFVSKASAAFEVGFKPLPADHLVPVHHASAVASGLAKGLIKESSEAEALFKELVSSGDMNSAEACPPAVEELRAWEEYSALLAEMEKTAQTVAELKRQFDEQVAKVREIEASLNARQAEINALQAKHLDCQQHLEQITKARNEQDKQDADLTQENELLLLQLHQVQEELEHYFLQYRSLVDAQQSEMKETRFLTQFWHNHQPAEIVLDMRREFEGDNWYDAEHDGRWAGPDEVSTIRLPALRSGDYLTQFDVVNAVEEDIVALVEISLNGTPLRLTREGTGYPALITTIFSTEDVRDDSVWEFQFRFPKVLSPEQHGLPDARSLAMSLRTLTLSALDPTGKPLVDMQNEIDREDHYATEHDHLSTGPGDMDSSRAVKEAEVLSRFWRDHHPAEIVLDLRGEIEGDNWYDAEHDGRWAGPEETSTLRLPGLRSGDYVASFDVVNAVEEDILALMEVSLNGTPFQLSREGTGYPALITACFSSEDIPEDPVWEFRFRFPKVLSADHHGLPDARSLAMSLRTLTLSARERAGEVNLDMRNEIDGENWYPAEHDGRWAGPGNMSSLRLPPLRSGQYEIQLEVVNAMEPGILVGMDVSLNGVPLELARDCAKFPAVIAGRFSTEHIPDRPVWELLFKFPKVLSPDQHGLPDARTLAISFRMLSIRPADR